jgi:23S rRNA (uracil1939-C5)-methyltransferase
MRHEMDVTIDHVGARGDGVAQAGDKRVYVPYTVPGDKATVRLGAALGDGFEARVTKLVAEGPGRAAPPCAHFGECGGCALQHWEPQRYLAWKHELVVTALKKRGLPLGGVEAIRACAPRTRRRADFTASRREEDLLLGFNARGTNAVINLKECHVVLPGIAALLPALREALTALLRPAEKAEIVVNALDGGLDVLIVTTAALGQGGRKRLAALAEGLGVVRVSRRHPSEARAETLVERGRALVTFGGVKVEVPPGAFLQATREGEAVLTEAVLAAAGTPKRAADLFCGVGTFTFALVAKGAEVLAADDTARHVQAVDQAAKTLKGARVTTRVRDLVTRPMGPPEFAGCDVVVFDPPRAGAQAQAMQIAKSRVPTVIAVSCEPGTFARDAQILAKGGYKLKRVLPIDQFLWSPHVELVAVFKR